MKKETYIQGLRDRLEILQLENSLLEAETDTSVLARRKVEIHSEWVQVNETLTLLLTGVDIAGQIASLDSSILTIELNACQYKDRGQQRRFRSLYHLPALKAKRKALQTILNSLK